jgi:peptidoglycan/xylan/chitin deacetylase (PgdA/CDA1 family)
VADVHGPRAAIPGIGPTLPPAAKSAVTTARSIWWLLRSRGRLEDDGLRILFYHRVSDDHDELAVSPRRFREQMELLATSGCRVVDLVEAADALRAGSSLRRTVVLNFDDGYLDVVQNALPVLEAHGFAATVFVPTGAIDGTARLSWYRRQPPLLAWKDIVELDRGQALRFEAHTVTHPNLLAVSDEAARAEVVGSKHALEANLGRAVEAFCYPAGLFGERERRLVAEAGFRLAVSCEPGVNHPGTEMLALRRRQIDARDTLLDFRAKLGGGHDSPLPLRGTYRRLRYGEQKPKLPARGIAGASPR